MEARWRAFALVESSIDVATEDLALLTSCKSSLLLRIRYSVGVDIVVRVGVGIQHSLPFGRLWTGGLKGGSCSILQPWQRPSHEYRYSGVVERKATEDECRLACGFAALIDKQQPKYGVLSEEQVKF